MYIKPQTVIPVDTKITRVAASNKKVPSLFSLEKAHERKLEAQADLKVKSAKFTALLKAGYTAVEALKLLSK